MHTILRVHIFEVRSPKQMKEIRATSDREHTLGTLTDHVVFEEQQVEEDRSLRAEWGVNVSPETLQEAVTDTYRLFKDTLNALVTREGHIRASRTENRQETMHQDLINEQIDGKQR